MGRAEFHLLRGGRRRSSLSGFRTPERAFALKQLGSACRPISSSLAGEPLLGANIRRAPARVPALIQLLMDFVRPSSRVLPLPSIPEHTVVDMDVDDSAGCALHAGLETQSVVGDLRDEWFRSLDLPVHEDCLQDCYLEYFDEDDGPLVLGPNPYGMNASPYGLVRWTGASRLALGVGDCRFSCNFSLMTCGMWALWL